VVPLKAAVTVRAWLMVTLQVVIDPVQSPVQPVNVWLAPGVAVSVTTVPDPKESEQKVPPFPQPIVPGLEATVPLPVTERPSAYVCSENVAVTERACAIVTWHVPAPLQPSPDQPSNDQAALGTADNVTTVPSA
jgi:hypothetical protein